MNKDSGIVLKNSDGIYFCGLNTFDNKLRKAQIYHSEKYAQTAAENINSGEIDRGRIFKNNVKRDFKLVKVEIKEV